MNSKYPVCILSLAVALAAQVPPCASGQPPDLGLASSQPPPTTVLPQFAFGGGWYSALYFTNNTGSPVSFPVSFVSDAGTAMTVPSLGASTKQVSLGAHGTAVIEAPNVGKLVQGYVEFTPPSGVSGYGVFRQSTAGQPDQEAVVPFSDAGAHSCTLTWDEKNLQTAIAIVNPSSSDTVVAVNLWDGNANRLGTYLLQLPAKNKVARYLGSFPGLGGMVGKRGSAQFSVAFGSVAVLGLRFDGQALTSIPTVANTTSSSGGSSVLPQFAFGGGWYSALYFTNTSDSRASFQLNFVSDAGTPLTVPSIGGSSTLITLPVHGTATIEAANKGPLTQGYAKFTLPTGVTGYGVFRQSLAGQPDQEAVVPLSDAGANSSTLTWDETKLLTAVAIVNPSATQTNVTVSLWDESGTSVGNSSIPLKANSKTALFLEYLQELKGMVGKRGSAQFSVSNGNVGVLGLRFDGIALTSIPATSEHGVSEPTVDETADVQRQ